MTRSAEDNPERAAAVRRAIPKVDRLLGSEELQPLIAAHSRAEVVRELRRVLDDLRRDAHRLDASDVEIAAVARRVAEGLARRSQPYYRRGINAPGGGVPPGVGPAALAPGGVAGVGG